MDFSMMISTMALFISGFFCNGCGTVGQKNERAEPTTVTSKEEFMDARLKYLADVENFRLQTVVKVSANNKKIDDLKIEVREENRESKAYLKKDIEALEMKNSNLKLRLDQFKKDSEDNWEAFKIIFNNDMDEVTAAIKDLTTINNR